MLIDACKGRTPSKGSLQSSKVSPHFLLCSQRKPPSDPKTPTLPLHPHLLSRASRSAMFDAPPPRRLTELRWPLRSSSTPNSELVRRLPSRPELELAFVWTRSRLLVELNRFANSVKLRRLTLVLLLRFRSFASRSPVVKFPLLLVEFMSFRVGTAAADTEREGRAREFGRLLRFEEVVPVRGLRPPPLEEPP